MTRRVISIAAIAAIVVALAGCSTALGLDPEQVLSDAAMTTAIKTRLAKDERLSTLTDISVSTTDDMVTVTGTVADETERQRIAEIARQIAGDNKFVDALRVVGSPSAAPRGPAGQKQ
jgi:osmotically-inducible protein OsmY